MSEEEPLKEESEEKEEVKNEKSTPKTTIDPVQEIDDTKWQTQTKHQRIISLVLYITLISFNGLEALNTIAYLIYTVNNTHTQWKTANYISYGIIMVFAICLGFYGLINLFRYGGTAGMLRNLEAITKLLKKQAEQLQIQTQELTEAVDGLEKETDTARERQDNLNDLVFESEEILRLRPSMKNVTKDHSEVSRLFDDIACVPQLIDMLKRQIIKNEMLAKFYQYEQDDGIDGLSKQEYERFINSLDKQTQDTWHNIKLSWRNLKGNDDIIDIDEFKNALHAVFDALDRQDAETVRDMDRRRGSNF